MSPILSTALLWGSPFVCRLERRRVPGSDPLEAADRPGPNVVPFLPRTARPLAMAPAARSRRDTRG
jgi:hypothetical protein